MHGNSVEKIRCVGTGFIALDIIRSAMDESTTLERRHAGGSCGNVLAILSFLGIQTFAVGRIGKDLAGTALVNDLSRSSVDVRFLVPEENRRTPIVIQNSFTDKRGNPRHRFSRVCPSCGQRVPGYRPLLVAKIPDLASSIPRHHFFFFDRVARGTVELARRAREQGAIVVFEPSGVKDEGLFIECLRVSHIFKYSRERLSNLDTLVSNAYPALQIETLGVNGLRFRIRPSEQISDWFHLPSIPAQLIRDSVGSGDWLTAGLVLRLAKMEDSALNRLGSLDGIVEDLKFGQALASLNCSYDGARGLMYAMDRENVLKATEQISTQIKPQLPEQSLHSTVESSPRNSCFVCSAGITEAVA